MVAVVIVGVGAPIGLAIRGYRRSEAGAGRWARERGLELTEEGRAMVAGYLRLSSALRPLGVLAGSVLTALAARALGVRDFGELIWFAVVAGYLVGVLYAEVAVRRPSGRQASMRVRTVQEYLSRSALQDQRWTAAGAAVIAAAAVVVPAREPEVVSPASRWLTLVAVVVVYVGVEALQRWLVRRPQPLVSPSLPAADDAIRVQSVHSIAGAGMGLQWLLGGVAMWALANSDVQLLRWTMWMPAMASWAIALVACTRFERASRQVQRA